MSQESDDTPFEHTVHIFAGGTVFHVRPHLALCAPAEGKVGTDLHEILIKHNATIAKIHPCRGRTNADVAKEIDELVADPKTKVIFMAAALCDFEGYIIDEFGDQDEGTSRSSSPCRSASRPRLSFSLGP